MPDQISLKLGAYLDGELDRRAQSEVQTHLKTCPACQAELDELQRLSILLRATPQPDFTPASDFKDQIMLQLPRRAPPQTLPSRPNGGLLPWLAPVLALGGWIFIQVTLSFSGLILLARQVGLLDSAEAWASSDPQQLLWFTTAQAAFGGFLSPQGQLGLIFLNDAGLFTLNMVIALLWQVGAVLLYWCAVTLMWHYKVKALWTPPMEG